jgi:hypothetical protein
MPEYALESGYCQIARGSVLRVRQLEIGDDELFHRHHVGEGAGLLH